MRYHSNESEFDLHENGSVVKLIFIGMVTLNKTRFETEAKGNLEMAD